MKYRLPSIKVNNRLKMKDRRSYPPQGTSTPPEVCVCVQNENNTASALRDIVQKLNLSSASQ